MRILRAALHPWTRHASGMGNARLSWPRREGLFVTLEDERGHTGWGEASPLPGYSRDTLEEARVALEAFSREKLPLELDANAPLATLGEAPVLSASARFALETAACDLAGHRLKLPLHRVLGGSPDPRPVPTQALLTISTSTQLAASALAASARGYRAFKIKIGAEGAFDAELKTLEALRSVLGDNALLRLDANQAFPADLLGDRLKALAALRPDYIEEPLAGGALETVDSSPVRLAADESLAEPGRAEKLAASGGCSVFVLKPMLLGGLARCLELSRLARAHGLEVVISHGFDGPVAFAAAAELALALSPAPLASGLARHPLLDAFADVRIPQLGEAEIVPGPWAGLGVEGLR